MGTALKVLGIVFLVVVASVAGCLFWSHEKGESAQEDFFGAVATGDPAKLLATFHPALAEKVDAPVLGVWMDAINEHLGAFQGLSASDFSTSASTGSGGSKVESKGTVEFAKGEARSELELVDGKVVSFRVTSDRLPASWFLEAPEGNRYQALGQEFLTKAMGGDAAGAHAMMHEGLQAQLTMERFEQGMANLVAQTGEPTRVSVLEELFEGGEDPILHVRYEIEGATKTITGKVSFKFTPWKGVLWAIDVPE